MPTDKLDYGKVFLIGFGFFGISVMWAIYNTYVPIFLQAGSPNFAAQALGFGLSATLTGFIMTLDNIAAFFIQPIMGAISDRTYTRIGRRMPYIITCAPIAVIAFALIPLAPQMIPPELNGQVDKLGGLFAFFIASLGVMLLAMAVFRTPVIALMPDLVPSPLRSKANGVINLMGGLGGILAFLIGGMLYRLYRPLPFWFGGLVTLIAVAILFWKVKEPPELVEAARHEEGLGVFRGLRNIPRENARSLTLLILAIFCWFVGFNAVETFFSSYGVAVLKISEATAGMILSIAYVTFILFSIPSGIIATRIGRKRTILIGLVAFTVVLIVAFFTPVVPVIMVLLAFGGLAWSLININSLPMVVDTSTSEEVLGTYTGLYYVAGTLAAVVGPILNGWVIDLTGRNYNTIFVVAPAFFILATLCMLGVT
ncbi:MAG: SLC45 family MFS transporter, partial [Anaerolineae bacterium]|nr:SLC45 family MFS transporter [Anaerolineae bacterium]MCX8066425.1 SLC45 family MFS transporter [Anaerolineae bacterium]